MKNIFVALGQHHVQNFENLIENKLVGEGDCILLAGSELICDPLKWSRIIKADRSFNNTADSAFNQVAAINFKIRAYKAMIKQISHYKSERTTVFVCYIEDVLSNFLFFSFNKNTKAVVVEDGTLNYYDHSLKNISNIKFLLKQAISQTHGIPFKKYKGHSSGAEYDHVVCQYLTLPSHSYIQKNVKQLPLDQVNVASFSNSLYIIGQESYGTLLGQSFFDASLENFLQNLKKQPFYKDIHTVYYKPHRNGKQFQDSYFAEVFSDKEVIVLRTEHTSETIYFEKLHSKYVAAFDSSTLINVYSKLKENNRNQVSFFVNPLKNDELIFMFKKLGFQFLNKEELK